MNPSFLAAMFGVSKGLRRTFDPFDVEEHPPKREDPETAPAFKEQ